MKAAPGPAGPSAAVPLPARPFYAPRFLATAFLATALLLLAGCATVPRPASPAPPPPAPPSAAAPVAPWELPPEASGTQSLYRVSLSGSEEGGTFRLTLLLESAERYQVRAVDPLGRALWTLDVAGNRGLWLDHRNRVACRLTGRFDLAEARLAPFPLASLPALLLGRLPASPAGGVVEEEVGEDGGMAGGAEASRLGYRDERGRRWSVRLEDRRPVAWTLWRGDEPVLWWSWQEGEAFLSDPERGNQLRWRRTVWEPLAGDLAAPAVPEAYRWVDCAALYG